MCDVARTDAPICLILITKALNRHMAQRNEMSDDERATDRWENEGGHRTTKI
jgi:hypothetical protein